MNSPYIKAKFRGANLFPVKIFSNQNKDFDLVSAAKSRDIKILA